MVPAMSHLDDPTLDAAADLQRLAVHAPAGAYPMWVGRGLLARAGALLLEAGLAPSAVGVVCQEPVKRRYAEPLLRALERAGFSPSLVEIPDGGASKTLTTVAALYQRFAALGFDRHTPILALGGGVVGDVAGFAAATFMRGMPLVQVPTTVLAMVDSSVGGKTGVDLPEGKNLVGAFNPPRAVIADVDVLGSLPAPERRSGVAEVLKHGIIGDRDLFESLCHKALDDIDPEIIVQAVAVKITVLEEDPAERGRRAVLNLGHTFGHGFEVASAYSIRHGEAVGVGMLAAAHLALKLGICGRALPRLIRGALTLQGLPIALTGLDPAAVRRGMAMDKKRRGGRPVFVLPRGIGDVILVEDPDPAAVDDALSAVLLPG